MPTEPQPRTSPKLTDQQRRAIHDRAVSIALSAGAGCGKTFVLTERFLAQLEPGAADRSQRPHLSQLVAITFTERAAREMRERIRAACAERLQKCPAAAVEHWLELLRELDAARISTIHSFCGSLLRAHAVEARLDPHFQVLDQAQTETLLYQLLDGQLRDRLVARDEAIIDLVAQFGLQRLYDMLATLLSRRQEIDWDRWRGETADELLARWTDFWRCRSLPAALEKIVQSRAAETVLRVARQSACTNAVMQERFALLLEQLPRLPQSVDPAADVAAIREAAKVQGGGSKKAWAGEEVYAAFSDAARQLRDLIDGLKPLLQFDSQAARPAAETALRLLGLAGTVTAAYQQEKEELAVLDFDDLLIRARDLLTAPQHVVLRKRLGAHLRLLLVDEFQDTDPLQVELVEALCGDELLSGKLFFVGDYKQSIYRFRGAQPQVFRTLRERIPPEGRLPLTTNFRSQPAVLDFINALFCEAMKRDGQEYEPLVPHRQQISPVPAVEFLWATDDGEEEAAAGMGEMERLRRREADWIARRIRGMLDAGEELVWDADAVKESTPHAPREASRHAERDEYTSCDGSPTARAVRPGDIALLFRALSNVEWYEEALRRYGIEYYLVGGHAFYAQQEIYDLVHLLRAIDDPADELSLVGVLRSPFFGLHDETLFWLSHQTGGVSAGLSADQMPRELADDQRRRAEFAACTLAELRAMKDRLPIARLIDEALARTGYDAVLLAEFLGERKLANLQKLIEQARGFDRSGIFTLGDFITQLSQFIARQPDEALAATHPESTDVVRLMTVHQSKGLEFPVVIVPDLDRMRRGPTTNVAFTRELGPMVKDPDVPSGFDLHMRAESAEEEAELVRLLYVATTRAADYLILSAGVPAVGSIKGPWTELLSRRFDLPSGQLRGTLPEGYRPPQIVVTTSEPPLQSKRQWGGRWHDLPKLLGKAQEMAEKGSGRLPRYLAAVPVDASARQQYSFSRLTGKLHGPRPIARPEIPGTGGQDQPLVDPRELGTLVHAVLAEVVFANPGGLAELVHRHAVRHLPDAGPGPDEAIKLIERFLTSPRAGEIAAARQVHAELEFLLAWPLGERAPGVGGRGSGFRVQQSDPAGDADRVAGPPAARVRDREQASTATDNCKLHIAHCKLQIDPLDPPSALRLPPSAFPLRYIQGFIDCLYEDAAGRLWLLDYKTNNVTAATMAATAAGYEMQMLVYALAVERILKRPPQGLILCFLRPGLEYTFDWSDAARARTVELVNQAMESLARDESR